MSVMIMWLKFVALNCILLKQALLCCTHRDSTDCECTTNTGSPSSILHIALSFCFVIEVNRGGGSVWV